jgi:hypothetical protein
MKRIEQEDLERLCRRINVAMGNPTGYTKGAYGLDYAYGGANLVEYVTESGGERLVIQGRYSKGELYDLMRAYLAGYEARVAQESHEQA